MKHDFKGGCLSCYKVLDGKECKGYMDYNDSTNYWSHCSVRDFKSYINRQSRFCLESLGGSGELWYLISLYHFLVFIIKNDTYNIKWILYMIYIFRSAVFSNCHKWALCGTWWYCSGQSIDMQRSRRRAEVEFSKSGKYRQLSKGLLWIQRAPKGCWKCILQSAFNWI